MKPDSDPPEQPAEAAAENIPVAGGGPIRRLKQFIQARYLRIIDALSGLLKRLRNRVKKSEESEGGEEGTERVSRKKVKEPPPQTAVTPPVPRSHVRSFFIYLLVLIIGVIAGMTFSFALLSKMLINQYQKIDDQREENAQLEQQNSRALESEARYRKKLGEVEAQFNRATRSTEKDIGIPVPDNSALPVAGTQAISKQEGKCTLESGNASNLAKCLDEFNRKGNR